MDKNTLSSYGWIVIVTLILSVMLALATPFGQYIKEGTTSVVNGFIQSAKSAMDENNRDKEEAKWQNKFEDIDDMELTYVKFDLINVYGEFHIKMGKDFLTKIEEMSKDTGFVLTFYATENITQNPVVEFDKSELDDGSLEYRFTTFHSMINATTQKTTIYITAKSDNHEEIRTNKIHINFLDYINENPAPIVEKFLKLRQEYEKVVSTQQTFTFSAPSSLYPQDTDYYVTTALDITDYGSVYWKYSVSNALKTLFTDGGSSTSNRRQTMNVVTNGRTISLEEDKVATSMSLNAKMLAKDFTLNWTIENPDTGYYCETPSICINIAEVYRATGTPFGIAYAEYFDAVDAYL